MQTGSRFSIADGRLAVFDAASADLDGDGDWEYVFAVGPNNLRYDALSLDLVNQMGTLVVSQSYHFDFGSSSTADFYGRHWASDADWGQSAAIYDEMYGSFSDIGGNSVDLADFDGDGDLDIFLIQFLPDWNTGSFSVFENVHGVFRDVTHRVAPFQPSNRHYRNGGGYPYFDRVSMADLNEDGESDLVLYSIGGDASGVSSTFFINDKGVFVPVNGYASPRGSHFGVGDFNCDGRADLVGRTGGASIGDRVSVNFFFAR